MAVLPSKQLIDLITLVQGYSWWVKLSVVVWILFTAGLIIVLIFQRPNGPDTGSGVPPGTGPTPSNLEGRNIQYIYAAPGSTVHVSQAAPAPSPAPVAAPAPAPRVERPPAVSAGTIVENEGFEEGFEGWGTGFFESLKPTSGVSVLGFNGAIARWVVGRDRVRSGERALRVEHETPYAAHTFSSLSQRIKVKSWHRYQVRYWIYIEEIGTGKFSMRVLPSRRLQPEEWDRFKGAANPKLLGQWQEVQKEFESGPEWFVDLRFAAEGTLKAWVDDVSVTLLGPQAQSGK